MKKLISLFLITIVIGGCSKIYQIQLPETAKTLLEQKNGSVTLRDNHHYETDNIHVVGDSLAFTDKKTDSARTVALRDIATVKRMSRSLAVSQGVVITIAALGFEHIGMTQLSHKRNPESIGAGPYILGGTILGGALGTMVHANTGSQESYIFNRDSLIAHSGETEKREVLSGDDRPEIKKVVKIGIEVGDYLANRSGSFSNIPGFSAGFLTGINLYSDERSQYVLGIDLSYNKITDYRTAVMRDFVFMSGYNYHHISDERYQIAFVELGIFPEYLYAINENITLGWYGGASIGIGSEYQSVNELSRTMIDSTYHLAGDYGPYGEYNIGPIRMPYCFSIGTSVYYKRLMVDLKYRYTNINAEYRFVNEYHNVYVQLGFVL